MGRVHRGDPHEGGARAHAHQQAVMDPGVLLGAPGQGRELLHLHGGQAHHVPFDIGGAYTREGDPVHMAGVHPADGVLQRLVLLRQQGLDALAALHQGQLGGGSAQIHAQHRVPGLEGEVDRGYDDDRCQQLHDAVEGGKAGHDALQHGVHARRFIALNAMDLAVDGHGGEHQHGVGQRPADGRDHDGGGGGHTGPFQPAEQEPGHSAHAHPGQKGHEHVGEAEGLINGQGDQAAQDAGQAPHAAHQGAVFPAQQHAGQDGDDVQCGDLQHAADADIAGVRHYRHDHHQSAEYGCQDHVPQRRTSTHDKQTLSFFKNTSHYNKSAQDCNLYRKK